MKEYIINILTFLIIISLISFSAMWIYNSRREERVEIIEEMAENTSTRKRNRKK